MVKQILLLSKKNVSFKWSGFVAKTLNAEILCGGPFIERNKVVQELHNKRIIVDVKYHFMEDSPFRQTLSTLTSTLTSTISIGTAVPKNIKEKLNSVHVHHSQVSDRYLSGGYNGNVGNFEVNFHFKGGIHWLKSTWSDT